jgi:hypothetical protein
MIHPDTKVVFINEEVGNGLIATSHIPKGTITWVLDPLDQRFTREQYLAMPSPTKATLDIYSFRDRDGTYVLCWDNGKYINHSFKSNCLTTAYDFEIAIRDIEPGEQLTDDYGYLNIAEPFKGANEASRRKYVYPDDLLRHYKTWDKALQTIFPTVKAVDQKLWHYLPPETVSEIDHVLQGRKPLNSIKENYYDQKNDQ